MPISCLSNSRSLNYILYTIYGAFAEGEQLKEDELAQRFNVSRSPVRETLRQEELREDNPEIDVTLLVAAGCHRLTTTEEIERKIGPDLAAKEKIRVHDCESPDNIQIGILPSGAPLVIDKTAVEADLVVAEGFIEPHFFAGFSGGRKSILPGICDRATVFGNHCRAFISDPPFQDRHPGGKSYSSGYGGSCSYGQSAIYC